MPNFVLTSARMAESADATVSNTVGATHPGSSPGPGTLIHFVDIDFSITDKVYFLLFDRFCGEKELTATSFI